MDSNITRCDQCNGFVRIRITCTKPLQIENYGIVTTYLGGKFCGSGCALSYLKINNKKKGVITKIK